MVTITPVEQQLSTGEVISGYRIDGASPLFEDGTIIPEGYDPDEDTTLTPQQKLALINILNAIESGGSTQSPSSDTSQQGVYPVSPQVPTPSPVYQNNYAGYQEYATTPRQEMMVTSPREDTTEYINQKARNFMEKKWSWLDRGQDILDRPTKAFSLYMRKQKYNMRKIGNDGIKNKKKRSKSSNIPKMFRF